ncbi:hypothetical protein BKA82DRAFT_4216067 [Pisolithus tinctorius]|nr:hypothetical protein BKA82DRAFT_4216067 [Pisolithus tinctorius]
MQCDGWTTAAAVTVIAASTGVRSADPQPTDEDRTCQNRGTLSSRHRTYFHDTQYLRTAEYGPSEETAGQSKK